MKIALEWPVEMDDGSIVRAVVIRLPTDADVEALAGAGWLMSEHPYPEPVGGKDEATPLLIARLTDLPDNVVDELDGADYMRVLIAIGELCDQKCKELSK